MTRRPPRSTRTDTLFPYTTLFRSRRSLISSLLVFGAQFGGASIAFLWPSLKGGFGALIDAGDLGEIKSAVSSGEPFYVGTRSEEHTSELQSLMRISYAVFCLKKKKFILYTINCYLRFNDTLA